MKKELIKKILTSKKARKASELGVFLAAAVVASPWQS